jgi:hypothetical protein
VSAQPTILTRAFWRSRRSAAVAGILFAVLLLVAMTLLRLALADDGLAALRTDPQRRNLVRWSLNIIPFAGIAFLWFIGVVRDRIGDAEDRFFATVFLGSGLLFIAMLFATGAIAGGLVVAAGDEPSLGVWTFGRRTINTLFTVYAIRMAAVFTISTTTIAARLRLAPRWLTIFGFGTGVLLLVTAGTAPWVELVFPTWVFVFSVHILIVSFRPQDQRTEQ